MTDLVTEGSLMTEGHLMTDLMAEGGSGGGTQRGGGPAGLERY